MKHTLLSLLLLGGFATAASPVTAVAYSPDGKLLAAGSRGVVHLIDSEKGSVLGELPGQDGRVTAVAFGSARRLAVASGEPGKSGVVRFYENVDLAAPTGKLVSEFGAHKDVVYAMSFSPDGRTLATAGYDRVIKLWDLPPAAKPSPRLTLTDHSDTVYALAFHPAGKLLASGAADRAVKVWDSATGKRLYTLGDSTDWVYAVAWNPEGTRLFAAGADKSIRSWDANAEGGTLLASVFGHTQAVTHLAFPAGGQTLFSVGEDRRVKSWDAAKLTEGKAHPPQPDSILGFAVRPDGKQFAVGRFDGVLQLLDAAGKVVSTPLPVKPKPPGVGKVTPDASPRGRTVRVVFEGTGLAAVTAVKSSAAGVETKIDPAKRTGMRLEADLTIPAATPPGAITFTLTSPGGDSPATRFFVDRFPAVSEKGRTDSARDAMTVALPATLAGGLDRAGDVDFFRFAAKAGDEVGVQLQTTAERAKFEPVLFLTDDAGLVVAEGIDGLLGYKCARPGTYAIAVHDRDYRGGAELAYRLHVGPVPVVTSVFPLGVTRGVETRVQLRGVHLGALAETGVTAMPKADAAPGSTMALPIPRTNGDPLGRAEVVVGEFPAVAIDPQGNGEVKATPGSVDGILNQPGQSHAIRFPARNGHQLVVETHAARLGSPVDPMIEILDESGKPVEQATLRCVARTYTTFRDHSADSPGIRLEFWNELGIDDLLYIDGDLMRIRALPKGPDDDCQFYQREGKRLGYLGTTPTFHAFGNAMYKVEVHPPGADFPPNGMPVFRLPYRNDDGGPGYGKDSRVVFDPPADGEYTVRVRDANGNGSPAHAYRLTVRPPRPDFAVRVSPANPKVWKDGAIPVTLTATRTDGYEGPIEVRFADVRPPFSIPATRIEASQESTAVTLSCRGSVSGKLPPVRVIATATIDGKQVTREATLGSPEVQEPGDLATTVSAPEVTIRPGGQTRLRVKIDRLGDFKGRVPLEVRGLPHGVRVLNIGLNGILVTPDVTEREVVLFAEPWVKPSSTPIVVLSRSERKNTEHAAPPVVLKISTKDQ